MSEYTPTMIKGVNFVPSKIDPLKNIFDYYGAIEINNQIFIAKETKDSETIYFVDDKYVSQSFVEDKLGVYHNYFEDFFKKDTLNLDMVLFATTKIVIPENIQHLYPENFYQSRVQYVKLDNIEIIPESCFREADELKTVILSDKTKFIDKTAFYKCDNLHYINLENVQFLGPHCFCRCVSLTDVKLDNVISVENMCFDDAPIKNITIPKDAYFYSSSINIDKSLPEKNKINFLNNEYNFYIELTNGYWAYQRNKLSKIKYFHFDKPINKENFIIDLNETFFQTDHIGILECDFNIINLKLPENIISIDDIDYDLHITRLDLNQVKKIGESFYSVNYELECLIANHLETLPKDAFSESHELRTVSFKNLHEIDNNALGYCWKLEKLDLNNVIFKQHSFLYNANIKHLNIENSNCTDVKMGDCEIQNFTLTNCYIDYTFLQTSRISILTLNNCIISDNDLEDLIFKQTLDNNVLIIDDEYIVEPIICNKIEENLDEIDDFDL